MATLIDNRRARFDYEILEDFEAGIELLGLEVKSLRGGRGSLSGAYVGSKGQELFLIGAEVPAYQPKNAPDSYNPKRDRRLLLNRTEIAKVMGAETQKGQSLIPLNIHLKNNKLKLAFAIGRGKKRHDKRQTIKKREADIEMHRAKSLRRK